MKSEEREPGTIASELDLYSVLVGIGIPLALHSETIFNISDKPDPKTLLDISEQFYLLSTVVANICTVNEVAFRKIVVSLGEDIRAVVVRNPLYNNSDGNDHPF